ncbi:hypothetical protein [Thermoactinomyces sp. CICC 10522]|uniref:hypothetical protein n=1 Tax=Thermoactinomyces sp. CICC 10522 TaxID=2767427 RepID=UPI0018DEB212|nr:hypothetical protein [Thermoactinomyces sp. CICC 10522]MBH8603667.1 hypothetical protein [Thermoactinomyces sp. CICC 10522]
MKSTIIHVNPETGEKMVEQSVFVTESTTAQDGSRYEKGNIYTVPQNRAEALIKEGKASSVSFPALEAISVTIDNRLNQFKKQYDEVKHHERYNDNESERRFQLQMLEMNLEADMQALKQKYAEELENLQREIARESLSVEFTTSETVNAYADNLIAEAEYTDDKEGLADLLAIKVSAMDDNERLTLLRRLGQIAAALSEGAQGSGKTRIKEKLGKIHAALKSAHKQNEYDLKLRQLAAIKQNDPLTNYRLYKMAVRRNDASRFNF